ncbi:CBS domain-containing protein [Stappia stellulata]|uniref:CBS domain-containing protein n=1 Tax=Stappia stellulata TaxID=71235 RepID=UPI0003F6C73D|nr:CBS domain-containing protein [Stappia stellulata]
MQVNEIMSPRPLTLTPEQTLREAARVMRRIDSGFVPVGDGGRLVGTLTDRDIVINALAQQKSAESPVSDAMTTEVLYCFEDQAVAEVARNMGAQQVRRLPVVNRDKRLVGIVSLGDLSRHGDPSAAGAALEQISV